MDTNQKTSRTPEGKSGLIRPRLADARSKEPVMNAVRQLSYQCDTRITIRKKRRLQSRLHRFINIGQMTVSPRLPKSRLSGTKTSIEFKIPVF